MSDSVKNNNKISLYAFASIARKELLKYEQCLWDKYLHSRYEDTFWHAKIDKIKDLHSILDNIENERLNPNFGKLEYPLVVFRSELANFNSILVKKERCVLSIKGLLANFFKLPGIKPTLKERWQARLLVKNLEALVEKTQESIYLSLSCQELLLAFNAFPKYECKLSSNR